MHAWESIQKTLDYIESNINREISIEELAKESSLSLFYYQRLFSRLVKKPVREYIKLRRLAHACDTLTDKKQRILDIALNCGFNSHENFTRAFKEAYKMTPEEYREHPVLLNQFDRPDLSLNYTMIDEGVPLISDGLVVEFNRKSLTRPILFMGIENIIPIEGQMDLGESAGVDLPGEVWMKFHSKKAAIPKIENGREIGVAYLGHAPEGHFTYFAGVEVAEGTENPNFTIWELPAREYIICGFEAENFEQLVTAAINKAVKFSQLWLEKHNLTMELYSPEIYYNSTPEGKYMELWLPAEEKK